MVRQVHSLTELNSAYEKILTEVDRILARKLLRLRVSRERHGVDRKPVGVEDPVGRR